MRRELVSLFNKSKSKEQFVKMVLEQYPYYHRQRLDDCWNRMAKEKKSFNTTATNKK